MNATEILQASTDGLIRPEQWQAARRADECVWRSPRVSRLAKIYDHAITRAIGSTDARLLANAMLCHWLYCQTTAQGYSADMMRRDLANAVSQASGHSRRMQWAARLAGGDALPTEK